MARNTSDAARVGQLAIFFQDSGVDPGGIPRYRGETTFGGWNTPKGDRSPIYLPSRTQPSTWDIIDTTQGAPGLPNSDFTARMNDVLYRIWTRLERQNCPLTIHILKDDCGRRDDINSWQFKTIYTRATLTDLTGPAVSPLSGDDEAPYDISGSMSALEKIDIFPIRFEEIADAAIEAEVVDAFYADESSCGGKCGERKDECNDLYALTRANSGSPGLSSQVVFSTDDKQTFTKVDISTLGGVSANAFTSAGIYVVVVSENDAAHHYIAFSDLKDGNAAAWSRVNSTYAAGLLDVHAKSPAEIYVAGQDGYIYLIENIFDSPQILTDGSLTTEDLRKIDAWSKSVVAVGNAGTVLVSTNNGASFTSLGITLQDGTTVTDDVSALALLNDSVWIIGTETGRVFYTLDQGTSYTEKTIDNNITIVNDIAFYNSYIGYMAVQMGDGTVRVYRTDTSGALWTHNEPSIGGLPTAERYSVVTPCGANEVAAGGRESVGGDGILAVALS